jgi:hypothetical protein
MTTMTNKINPIHFRRSKILFSKELILADTSVTPHQTKKTRGKEEVKSSCMQFPKYLS